jgi:hypothetical protein
MMQLPLESIKTLSKYIAQIWRPAKEVIGKQHTYQ